ncbi:MAG: hypothetical protein WC095_02530 [Candidatus Paceibacterota bacterium]
MKKVWFFAIFFAMLALPVFAQRGEFTIPADAEMDKFPVVSGPLSTRQQAEMRLAPHFLRKAIVVQNHFRGLRDNKGRFVLETLPANTIVLVDTTGTIRYKADCGNRLVEVPKPVEEVASTVTYSNISGNEHAPLSAWGRFKNAMGRSWGGLAEILGSLIPLLLFMALLALLGYAVYRVIQNRREGRRPLRPTPPTPAPTPAPLTPRPTPVQLMPLVAPVQPQTPPVTPPQNEEPEKQPPTRTRRFRLTIGKDGNVFAKMEGYKNLRVDEDEQGNLTVNADRN